MKKVHYILHVYLIFVFMNIMTFDLISSCEIGELKKLYTSIN